MLRIVYLESPCYLDGEVAILSIAVIMKGRSMKVGNRKVIFNETIYVPDGEVAEMEHPLSENDLLRCRFSFDQHVDDSEGIQNPIITIGYHEGLFDFHFINFTHALGHTITTPSIFGFSDKQEPLVYIAGVFKLTNYSKLEIQIMMEEPTS